MQHSADANQAHRAPNHLSRLCMRTTFGLSQARCVAIICLHYCRLQQCSDTVRQSAIQMSPSSLAIRDRMNLRNENVFNQAVREGMTLHDQIVFIVDEDRRICEAVSDLLSTFDLHVVTFGSAADYIAYPKPDVPACLLLDVELPGINGLDLQSQLAEKEHPQIVFLTGHGDIPS